MYIPSRELTYPTLGSSENHLQNAIFGGYVSSLEGMYIINNVNFNDVPRISRVGDRSSSVRPKYLILEAFSQAKNPTTEIHHLTHLKTKNKHTKQNTSFQIRNNKNLNRKKNATSTTHNDSPQKKKSKLSKLSKDKTDLSVPFSENGGAESTERGVQLLQVLLSLWHCIQQLLLSVIWSVWVQRIKFPGGRTPRFARHLKRWLPGILEEFGGKTKSMWRKWQNFKTLDTKGCSEPELSIVQLSILVPTPWLVDSLTTPIPY